MEIMATMKHAIVLHPMRQSLTQSRVYIDQTDTGLVLWSPDLDAWRVPLDRSESLQFGDLLTRKRTELSIRLDDLKERELLRCHWQSAGRSDKERLCVQGEGHLMWLFSVQSINEALATFGRRVMFGAV